MHVCRKRCTPGSDSNAAASRDLAFPFWAAWHEQHISSMWERFRHTDRGSPHLQQELLLLGLDLLLQARLPGLQLIYNLQTTGACACTLKAGPHTLVQQPVHPISNLFGWHSLLGKVEASAVSLACKHTSMCMPTYTHPQLCKGASGPTSGTSPLSSTAIALSAAQVPFTAPPPSSALPAFGAPLPLMQPSTAPVPNPTRCL